MAITSYGQRTKLGEMLLLMGTGQKFLEAAQTTGHSGACCHRRTMDWPVRLELTPDPTSILFQRHSIQASAVARMTGVHCVIRLPRRMHHQTCKVKGLYRCYVHCVRDAWHVDGHVQAITTEYHTVSQCGSTKCKNTGPMYGRRSLHLSHETLEVIEKAAEFFSAASQCK